MKTFGRQLRGDAPGYSALPVAHHACAMGAVQGILAALLAREKSGRGQRVETSLLQGLLPYDLVDLLLVQLIDRGAIELPDPSAGDMPTLNYHPLRAKDGRWIQCGNLMEHLFYAFLDSIDCCHATCLRWLIHPMYELPPSRDRQSEPSNRTRANRVEGRRPIVYSRPAIATAMAVALRSCDMSHSEGHV